MKWQVVAFNGDKGHESKGIVDMIAIRKKHRATEDVPVGDLFEIVLVQVKGGGAKFPSPSDIARLEAVARYHRADKVVLTEWKKGKRLSCYVLPDMTSEVPAYEVFGKGPSPESISSARPKTGEDARP